MYKQGRLSKGEFLWLYLLPNDGGKVCLGLSISRRAIKDAVSRNRTKRIIKEWFRQYALINKTGYDIVVSVKKKPASGKTGAKLIRDELAQLLQ